MTITEARCYRYSLPLVSPLTLGSVEVVERIGLLLRLEGESGAVGWGEAAPLPEFSTETADDAAEALRDRAAGLRGTTLSDDLDGLLKECRSLRSPPSVQFAVESAAVELLSVRSGGMESGRILEKGQNSVRLNALVTTEEDLEREGGRLRRAGFSAVKLKVGRHSIDVDARRVRALRSGLGPEVSLRLDANRAWTLDEAVAFSEKLASIRWEYIEEPLADPSQLGYFVARTNRPVAIDETTREMSHEQLSEYGRLAAVVLKPTLLGGIGHTRQWARAARYQNADVVLSASHESGVGLRMLVALASSFSTLPAGLSTYTLLAHDVLEPRLSLDGATVTVNKVYESSVEITRLSALDES